MIIVSQLITLVTKFGDSYLHTIGYSYINIYNIFR